MQFTVPSAWRCGECIDFCGKLTN